MEVTGLLNMRDLLSVLKLLVEIATSEIDGTCKIVTPKFIYQITEDGAICLGWKPEKVPKEWLEFKYAYDLEEIASVIYEQLSKHPIKDGCCFDKHEAGFRVRMFPEVGKAVPLWDNVKNPYYCLVVFEPYTCTVCKIATIKQEERGY